MRRSVDARGVACWMQGVEPRGRYVLVDALRGLACLGVVTYHFGTNDLEPALSRALGSYTTRAFERGWIGVHVFFVLSGFVIAHGIGATEMTWARAGRFFLRRQVRLDPPYWCAIALATALAIFWRAVQPGTPQGVPSPRLIVAHVLYVYDLLGMPGINAVFWSLAIEVQFYLTFVLVLALLRRTPRVLPWAIAAMALVSLRGSMTWSYPHAWGAQHWFLFALGVLTRWALDRRASAWLLLGIGAVFVAAGVSCVRLEPVSGAAVALLLYVAGRRDALTRWLGARPLQWLGGASYSVYLLHTMVASNVRFLLHGHFDPHRPLGALTIFLTQIAAAMLSGGLLHRTVERWAIGLAGTIDWKNGGRRYRTAPAREAGTARGS